MLVKVPFPPFALSQEDVAAEPPTNASRPPRAEAEFA
jgi:hypothetical protein